MDLGAAIAFAGCIAIVGFIGTFFKVQSRKGPRERSLAVRLAILSWVWVGAAVAWQFAVPRPWNEASILLVLSYMLSNFWMSRMLAQARTEDEAEAR